MIYRRYYLIENEFCRIDFPQLNFVAAHLEDETMPSFTSNTIEDNKNKIDEFFNSKSEEELKEIWAKYDKYSPTEESIPFITLQVTEGSLVASPLISKEKNIEMFNQWLKDTYAN